MMYQLQYWKKDGSLIAVTDHIYSNVLYRLSDDVNELLELAKDLDPSFAYSILEVEEGGSLTPYVED